MKSLKTQTKKFLMIVLVWIFLGLAGYMEVSASASERAETGKITLELNDLGTEKLGVVFRLYNVSEIEASVTSSALSDLSVRELKELAEELKQKAEQKNVSFLEQTTDENGKTVFTDVREGIYLISQYGQAKYGTVDPFLITVPYSEDGKTFEYDVVVRPKGEIHPPEPTTPSEPSKPNPPVKTGDETPISLYVLLTFVGGIAVVVLLILKKRKK